MNEVFVYGTLLNDEVLEAILKRTPAKRRAQLSGYKRVRVLREAYPAIRPDSRSYVDGFLLADLSDNELKKLDEYEGVQYDRVVVEVSVAGCKSQCCMTYVFRSEFYPNLSIEEWSNEEFREKYLEGSCSKNLKEVIF